MSLTVYTYYFLYIISASKLGNKNLSALNLIIFIISFFISNFPYILSYKNVKTSYTSFSNKKFYFGTSLFKVYYSTVNHNLSLTDKNISVAVSYDNLHLYAVLKQIFQKNKRKPGVYRLINKLSGKTYVGSSIDLTKILKNYFSMGYLKNSSQKKTAISRALVKYGYSNFKLEIIKYTTPEKIRKLSSPVEVTDLKINTNLVYNTSREAAESFPCSISTINKCIRTQKLYKNRHKITRVKKNLYTFIRPVEYNEIYNKMNNIISKLDEGGNSELNTASLTSSHNLITGNIIYNNIYISERLNSQQILLRLNPRSRFYNPKKHYSKLLFTNITSYILPLLTVYSYKVITCLTHNKIYKNTPQKNFIHLTKQIRYYSPIKALHPEWVTGFIDAEGCFHIAVKKNDKLKLGWKVQLVFQMELHSCDEEILICIQAYFRGIGLIYHNRKRASVRFELSSLKDLEILIKHFDRYPLITEKQADYILWKQAFEIVQQREHLIIEGLREIVAKKATMNTANLSEKLKIAFPNLIPVHRPVPLSVINKQIKPYWISGFISGEGSFMVKIKASKSHSLGYQTQLEFQVSQHSRDELLIKYFIEYFDCGYLRKNETRPLVDFKVTRFDDILCKIIPFIKKYPVIGVKNEDFADWCKVAELIKVNKHLTEEGLDRIRQIKVSMNKGRKEEWKK